MRGAEPGGAVMRKLYGKDSNHDEIKNIFLYYGFDVVDTSGFSGKMLDLLVTLGHRFFQFIETKDGNKPKSKRALTDDEKIFIAKRPDHCSIIETKEQAKAFCAHVIAGERF